MAHEEYLRRNLIHCSAGGQHVLEVTKEFDINPSTVRRALKRAETLNVAA